MHVVYGDGIQIHDLSCVNPLAYNDGRIGHFDSSDLPDSQIFVIFSLTNWANHKAELI